MRYQSYFNTALSLIRLYDGTVPLVHFLKKYFSEHKKHGSRDRKLIAHLCYSYYRIGHALLSLDPEKRLRIAIFLCEETASDWAGLFEQQWLTAWSASLPEKINWLQKEYPGFTAAAVFPWIEELSAGMEPEAFILSHFIQPDLFLRIRPGKQKQVLAKLADQHIAYSQPTANCLALANTTKIDSVLDIDKEVVIQDYSSQQVAGFFSLITHHSPLTLWDCCAASGGKSLLAMDTLPRIDLTVSDIRPSILRNLKERFDRAGIRNFQSFVTDLTQSPLTTPHSPFHIVICDAPCSGSGTWGRTPEQLYFFTEVKITEYATLQKKIIHHVIPQVAKGGYFLYITCSVFKKENEQQVQAVIDTGEFELVKMKVLKGYDRKADSMFAALLKRVREVKGK
jgi:16S rRNA (cytosine967-C5)-methyltransferase